MKETKEHKNYIYERMVFISRQSAIGDVIIASHAVLKLIINGYFPVFVTSHLTKDIALCMNGLKAIICHQTGKNNVYYFNGTEVTENHFIQKLSEIKTKNKIVPNNKTLQKPNNRRKKVKLQKAGSIWF